MSAGVDLADLASTASSKGAALVGFKQAGAGAIDRLVQDKLRELVSVKDFGATGDGVTDDTAAIQAAVNGNTGNLYFPQGTYLCGAVTINRAMSLFGEESGKNSATSGTVIQQLNNTTNIFTVDTAASVTFRDLCFQGIAPTTGAAITLQYSSGVTTGNLFSSLENIRFENMFVGVNCISASSWAITDCVFWNIPVNGIGIQIDDTINKDVGDQSITSCTFLGDVTATGILWIGGGGTRIVTNKFLMAKCIYANLANATAHATAQLLITNNSFDANNSIASTTAVVISAPSGTVPFQNIIISDNFFISYGAMANMLTIVGIATAVINKVVVTGNSFLNANGPISGNGMIVIDYVTQFLIANNLLVGPGSSNGINLGANCSAGSVVSNEIQAFATPIINSAGTAVRVRGVTNSGVSASVSDGGAITHGLGVTPTKVWLNGSVAAQTYNPFGINSTQFSVSVRNTAGSSGTAATIYWQVEA